MKLRDSLASYGKKEDHLSKGGAVVHVSAPELSLLEEVSGNTSVNPDTGLRQFYYGSTDYGDYPDIGMNLGDYPGDVGDLGPGGGMSWDYTADTDAVQGVIDDWLRGNKDLGRLSSGEYAAFQAREQARAADDQAQKEGYTDHKHKVDTDAGKKGLNDIGQKTYEAKSIELGYTPGAEDFNALYGWLGMTAQQAAQQTATGAFNQAMDAGYSDPAKAVLAALDSPVSFFAGGDFTDAYQAGLQAKFNKEEIAAKAQLHYKTLEDDMLKFRPGEEDDLKAAMQRAGITDYNPYESTYDYLRRGGDVRDLSGAQIMETALSTAIPSPVGLGPGIASMIGRAVDKSVIGTFSSDGVGYNLHQDGSFTLSSPSPGPANMNYGGGPRADSLWPQLMASTADSPFDRQGALQTLLQELLADESLGEFRPLLNPDELDSIITNQLVAKNNLLPADATQQQFEGEFGSSLLGQNLLTTEEGERQARMQDVLGTTFTGNAFEPISDDAAITGILEEERNKAFDVLSRFEARGNLNPLGGRTANKFLVDQAADAKTRLEELGESVRATSQLDVSDIRDRALSEISQYRLGAPTFDPTPFTTERSELIGEREGTLRGDITELLGGEQVFDVQSALQRAALTSGLSSGPAQGTLLDVLAEREGQQRDQRGLGNRGSGVF